MMARIYNTETGEGGDIAVYRNIDPELISVVPVIEVPAEFGNKPVLWDGKKFIEKQLSEEEIFRAAVAQKVTDVNALMQNLTSDEALAANPRNLLYLSIFGGAISTCMQAAAQNPSITTITAIINVVDSVQAPDWCTEEDVINIGVIKANIKAILQR